MRSVDKASTTDHSNDSRFVSYYEKVSSSDEAYQRSIGIMEALQRSRRLFGMATEGLTVADIGCNAGAQSQCWLDKGHTVHGLDVSRDLVAIARRRNERFRDHASFEVGSAENLPWGDQMFDVSLLLELLEHVENWKSCLTEAVRVLRPGGTICISTTNALCPVQDEFNLPAYSWYPGWVKRYFLQRAMTTSPEIVNFATYPAFHWFSPYSLRQFLSPLGIRSFDRFDIMDVSSKRGTARVVVGLVRSVPPLRFLGHMLTPGTIIVGHKLY